MATIAEASPWFEQARQLALAVDQPDQYDRKSFAALLQDVARMVGCVPLVLLQRIAAWRFLEQHYPDRIAMLSETTSMRALLTLSRAQAAAPEAVAALLDETIAGRHSVRSLEQRLASMRAAMPLDASPTQTRKRQASEAAREFEAAVGALLAEHSDLVWPAPGAKVFPAGRKRAVHADFVVEVAGREVAVIEVKAPQLAFHARQATELLAVMALHATQGLTAWLVVPARWTEGLDRVVARSRRLTLPEGIRFATVDEAETGRSAFQEIER